MQTGFVFELVCHLMSVNSARPRCPRPDSSSSGHCLILSKRGTLSTGRRTRICDFSKGPLTPILRNLIGILLPIVMPSVLRRHLSQADGVSGDHRQSEPRAPRKIRPAIHALRAVRSPDHKVGSNLLSLFSQSLSPYQPPYTHGSHGSPSSLCGKPMKSRDNSLLYRSSR